MDCLGLQGCWTTADSGCYTWLRYLDEKPACCLRTCCLQMGPGSGRVIPALGEHTLLSSSSSSAPYFITTPIRQSSQWNPTFTQSTILLFFNLNVQPLTPHEAFIWNHTRWLRFLAKIPTVCGVHGRGGGYECVCSQSRCLGDEQTHRTARPLSFGVVEAVH